MVRWQPGARERLSAAAMHLFAEQGFERTSVAELAAAAQLTERTFFRHFTDKREVLFAGQDDFERMFTDAVTDAPDGATPLDLVRRALSGADAFFDDDKRPFSRLRQVVVDGEPSLQERELLKMAKLKRALGTALRERGIPEANASLAAETAVGVFHLAFAAWIADGETRPLSAIADELFSSLRTMLT
jgi:AcrR family transcriptional regulator